MNSTQASQFELIQGFQLFGTLVGLKAHPAEIVALQIGRQDAAVDFGGDARADQRRYAVERVAEQIVDVGEGGGGFGGEQIDGRFGGIRQTDARALHGDVRRKPPVGFLADQPDAVGDLVDEAPLTFGTFRQRQRDQFVAPPEILALVFAAVADAGVFEKARRQQRLSIRAEAPLRRWRSARRAGRRADRPMPRDPLPLGTVSSLPARPD